MSTSYGHAIVQFPGFPPISFRTIDGVMRAPAGCGKWSRRSARNVEALRGKKMRLSKKERSSLTTFVKKWNKQTRYVREGRNTERVRPYKTLEDLRDW